MRPRRRRFSAAAAVVALAAAGCAAHHQQPRSAAATLSATARRDLAARYLVIARAGNRHLETDFRGLEGRHLRNLAAARADLRDAAATERLFDRRLLALPLPPDISAVARLLVYLNTARADLTSAAAALPTLRDLRAALATLRAANAPVEREVSQIRRMLGLPPPSSS